MRRSTHYALDEVHNDHSVTNVNSTDGLSGYVSVIVTNVVASLLQNGVSGGAILYTNGWDEVTNRLVNGVSTWVRFDGSHITAAANVAGYVCYGDHSALGNQYGLGSSNDGSILVSWHGASGWWLIDTVESFNGQPVAGGQGDYWMWFGATAFGSTNYENTPVGAVTHTDEPTLPGINRPDIYLGFWAAGKNAAICAWAARSRGNAFFQAVGDPFVTR